MNDIESTQIIAMLETNWQPFKNTNAAIKLWASAFAEDPFELVNTAVMASDFRPNIGQVRQQMRDIIHGEKMSEVEAWLKVKDSLHEAQEDPENLTGARSAWKKLPADVQKLVTPRQLLDWNSVETSTLDTVIQSNFMRSYRDVTDRRYKKEALPNEIKKRIETIRQATGLYIDPEEKPELPQPQKVSFEKPDWMIRRDEMRNQEKMNQINEKVKEFLS